MPALRRLVLTVAAVLTAGALTAGCDAVQPEPTITKQQAVDRVAARAQEAFQQLPAGATLKLRSNEPDMPCDDGPDGRTFVETDYTIEYPQGWPVQQTMATLADYWTTNGYQTVRDERADATTPGFSVEHPDGFRIGIQITNRDSGRIDAYLISSSPCL
jgi:hypothetical protein